MKKLTSIQTNAVNAYSEYLASGMTYGDAMRTAAKALGGTACPTFLGELAAVHAEKYACSFTWDGKGQAVFFNGAESTRETRNDAARKSWSRKSWSRNVMVWFTPEREAKPVKQMRLSAEARQAAKAYLAQFDSVADAIKALKAVA
jgi:hypothetical protein